MVLVQDYHLSLTGAMLAEARPDLRTVHFTHTPFADPNVLRTLPADGGRRAAGRAGRLRGLRLPHRPLGGRLPRPPTPTPSWPPSPGSAGPRPPSWPRSGPTRRPSSAEAASPSGGRGAGRELDRLVGGRKLIVRVDRVELSKNILRGFWAFDELLETHPEWRGQVVLLALAYPSREGLAEYLAYRTEVEHTVERINETWGTADVDARSSSTWPTTGTARWPPSAATTSCWSTRCATG